MIRVVVVDGGPCSGKTSFMDYAKTELRKRGFRVLVKPEIATLVHSCGIDDLDVAAVHDRDAYYHYELAIAEIDLDMTRALLRVARSWKITDDVIVLLDRYIPSVSTYTTQEEYVRILTELDQDREYLYGLPDLVVCMVTAANGASEHYNLNNVARRESLKEAVEVDHRQRDLWKAHKNVVTIDNSTDFNTKLERALSAILKDVNYVCSRSPEDHR